MPLGLFPLRGAMFEPLGKAPARVLSEALGCALGQGFSTGDSLRPRLSALLVKARGHSGPVGR
eukprot:9760354-Alexandrium_andersonii.AAC.1